jgi:hypothetical protein
MPKRWTFTNSVLARSKSLSATDAVRQINERRSHTNRHGGISALSTIPNLMAEADSRPTLVSVALAPIDRHCMLVGMYTFCIRHGLAIPVRSPQYDKTWLFGAHLDSNQGYIKVQMRCESLLPYHPRQESRLPARKIVGISALLYSRQTLCIPLFFEGWATNKKQWSKTVCHLPRCRGSSEEYWKLFRSAAIASTKASLTQ